MGFVTSNNITIANSQQDWIDNALRNMHHIKNIVEDRKKSIVQLFNQYSHWDAHRLSRYYHANARRLINLLLSLEFKEILFPDYFAPHRKNVAQKLIIFAYRALQKTVDEHVKPLKQNLKQSAHNLRQIIRMLYKEWGCMNPRLRRMGDTAMRTRIPVEPLLNEMTDIINARGIINKETTI